MDVDLRSVERSVRARWVMKTTTGFPSTPYKGDVI